MKRLYSLYQRPRDAGKRSPWMKISPLSLPKEVAIRHFQSVLIHSSLGGTPGLEYRLRPVKEAS